MIRGFAIGTLTLAVAYVLLQSGAASRLEAGGNVLVKGMKRLFDPTVAGIGDHTKDRSDKNTINPGPVYAAGGGGTAKAM